MVAAFCKHFSSDYIVQKGGKVLNLFMEFSIIIIILFVTYLTLKSRWWYYPLKIKVTKNKDNVTHNPLN